jgi:hypothetical protein
MSAINLRNSAEKNELAVLEKNNPELANLIAIYPEEAINNLLNNKEKLTKIAKYLENTTTHTSVNTMIMQCSENCIFKNVCVLYKNGLAPFGFSCPIEKKVIMEMESDIVEALDIDRNNPIEMEMLWDLIETKILDMRASGALNDGKLIQVIEQKLGSASVTKEEVSPTLEMKLELKKLKHSIIDSFVGTRRAKKRYGMSSDANTLEAMLMQAANNVDNK